LDPAISNFTRDDMGAWIQLFQISQGMTWELGSSCFKFHKGWHGSLDPAVSNFIRDGMEAWIQLFQISQGMTWDPAISNFTRDDSYFKFHKG
jgi:hypothetical protein